MIRTGIAAFAIMGSTVLAMAQTAAPAAPGSSSPNTATTNAPSAPVNPAARGTTSDSDPLLQPARVKHRTGPLRGAPIIAGNPAIRVDRSGQVITSEQP